MSRSFEKSQPNNPVIIDANDKEFVTYNIDSNTPYLLIDTGINVDSAYMFKLELTGYVYGKNEILDTKISFYDYPTTHTYINPTHLNNGYNIGSKIFEYQGRSHILISNIAYYTNINVELYNVRSSGVDQGDRKLNPNVLGIREQDIPTEISRLVIPSIKTSKTTGEITAVGGSLHNLGWFLRDGQLYTTSGSSVFNDNGQTGRFPDANAPLRGMDNFKRVMFPNNPGRIKKVGGNGYGFMAALFENGYLFTWGRNTRGSCGFGHTNPITHPKLLATGVQELYTDSLHNGYGVDYADLLFKKSDGYVYGCGDNDTGQLGLGHNNNLYVPTKLTWLGTNPKFVGHCNGSYASNIYQKSDGTIWAAGTGSYGACFTKTTTAVINVPVEITDNIGGISGGDIVFYHSAARFMDNNGLNGGGYSLVMRKTEFNVTSIYTVGHNYWGQIGNNTTTNTTTPYKVPNMSDVKDITVNGGAVPSIFVLKNNNDLYGWGYAYSMCNGDSNVLVPILIETDVAEILSRRVTSNTYDYYTQVFIKMIDGYSIKCWGSNSSGAYLGLGYEHVGDDNTTSRVKIPTVNSFLSDPFDPVKFMGSYVTGENGRCWYVVTESNKMFGFGYNTHNGVFDMNTIHVLVPTSLKLPD